VVNNSFYTEFLRSENQEDEDLRLVDAAAYRYIPEEELSPEERGVRKYYRDTLHSSKEMGFDSVEAQSRYALIRTQMAFGHLHPESLARAVRVRPDTDLRARAVQIIHNRGLGLQEETPLKQTGRFLMIPTQAVMQLSVAAKRAYGYNLAQAPEGMGPVVALGYVIDGAQQGWAKTKSMAQRAVQRLDRAMDGEVSGLGNMVGLTAHKGTQVAVKTLMPVVGHQGIAQDLITVASVGMPVKGGFLLKKGTAGTLKVVAQKGVQPVGSSLLKLKARENRAS
jgi:hypothetical protein